MGEVCTNSQPAIVVDRLCLLQDHKADTLSNIVNTCGSLFAKDNNNADDVQFLLAAG